MPQKPAPGFCVPEARNYIIVAYCVCIDVLIVSYGYILEQKPYPLRMPQEPRSIGKLRGYPGCPLAIAVVSHPDSRRTRTFAATRRYQRARSLQRTT